MNNLLLPRAKKKRLSKKKLLGYLCKLSAREKEVAKEMSIHSNAKKVAEILGVTDYAIYYHCKNIKKKLEEDTTFGAILKAVKHGII